MVEKDLSGHDEREYVIDGSCPLTLGNVKREICNVFKKVYSIAVLY